MNRMKEAKTLKKQGFTCKEISEKMNIKLGAVLWYIYEKEGSQLIYRERRKEKDLRRKISLALKEFSLPLEWEEETLQLYKEYRLNKRIGYKQETDILSVIQLLCRRHKFPTPKSLYDLTSQGYGSKRLESGYMHALNVLNGVNPAKPLDYIIFFINSQKLPPNDIGYAKKLLDIIPPLKMQGKNPRVIAGTILYFMYRTETQEEIAKKLQITAMSIRNCLHEYLTYWAAILFPTEIEPQVTKFADVGQ